MTKGIDKRNHERLIGSLKELFHLTEDAEGKRRIESDIASLSGIYDSYTYHIRGVESHAESYHKISRGIQVATYKELRIRKKHVKHSNGRRDNEYV